MKKCILVLCLFLYSTFELHSQDVRDTTNTIYIHNIVQDTSIINKKDEYGRKQGRWYKYTERGVVTQKWEYLDDMKHGCNEFYTYSGKLLVQCYYKYDKLDSIYREYWNWGDADGKLRVEAYFKDGLPHGVTNAYAKNGELITRINYQYGEIDSTDSHFYISEDYNIKNISMGFVSALNLHPRLDTIDEYSSCSSCKYKEYLIYYNNSLYKSRLLYKNKLRVEDFYIQGINTKTIAYYHKKPYGVKRIYYYTKDGKLPYKIEYYNRKGVLVKTIFCSRCGSVGSVP